MDIIKKKVSRTKIKFDRIKLRDKSIIDQIEDEAKIRFRFYVDDYVVEKGISYQDYKRQYALKDPDKTAYKGSKIMIRFDYPNYQNPVIFTLVAENPLVGFSYQELLNKVYCHYEMLHFLNRNYDLEKNEYIQGCGSNSFGSVDPISITTDYENNGIYGLDYNKGENIWTVQLLRYL